MSKDSKPKTYLSSYNNSAIVREAFERLDRGETLTVFDTETTGLASTTDRVLSFSALKLQKIDGILRETGRMNIFINPGFHIPAAATAVNHISDETVRGCDTEVAAAVKIRGFLGEAPFLAGYNSISFDAKFMNAMYNRVFGTEFLSSCHVDVHKLAKEKLPGLQSYKLESVTQALGTGAGVDFHNSMDDVIATARNLKELLDMYKENAEFCSLMRVTVLRAQYWDGPNRQLKRVYVKTQPYTKSYYDCYFGRWESDNKNVDLESLRRDTLRAYNVENEKELVALLK